MQEISRIVLDYMKFFICLKSTDINDKNTIYNYTSNYCSQQHLALQILNRYFSLAVSNLMAL